VKRKAVVTISFGNLIPVPVRIPSF